VYSPPEHLKYLIYGQCFLMLSAQELTFLFRMVVVDLLSRISLLVGSPDGVHEWHLEVDPRCAVF
jgi:hypothetical protein